MTADFEDACRRVSGSFSRLQWLQLSVKQQKAALLKALREIDAERYVAQKASERPVRVAAAA